MADETEQNHSKTIKLYEDSSETAVNNTARYVTAEIHADGSLALYCQDIGQMPLEFWGDSDYEFWVTVPAAHKDALLLALIEKVYQGDSQAVDHIRDLLKAHDIEHHFDQWM